MPWHSTSILRIVAAKSRILFCPRFVRAPAVLLVYVQYCSGQLRLPAKKLRMLEAKIIDGDGLGGRTLWNVRPLNFL